MDPVAFFVNISLRHFTLVFQPDLQVITFACLNCPAVTVGTVFLLFSSFELFSVELDCIPTG